MASTYSTNLKLQLMATGENTGTWGSVTNTNLGTALEEAIVGSVDVTFASADVTLSLTNTNANQTARNMRLVLVGVSGGARQLVVPAVEKIYIVKNELTDTCTVKVSGQTGVAVPAGKTMWLCNDGTDVKDVVTHLSSLTLASPLPVGSGGTGATSLNGIAFTGENITNLNASNISSGTIANARTTASSSNGASTIVARGASGEFSAGVITADGSGMTALNASNVSSGTLAVARGGTGAGTFSSNNVLLGNGTSAFQTVAPGTSGNVLTSNGTTWTSSAAFVTGMILLWSGSIATVPSGWALCDGTNGTPNLRDRFIVGAGNTYAVNATGGSADAIVVSHTHTATSSVTDSGHTHSVPEGGYKSPAGENLRYSDTAGGTNSRAAQTTGSSTTGITVSTTVASAGTSGTNANLPPYYALAYIMKL